ncbi:hypothetical protein F4809DRAFT_663497 [Biscogniauxia mediterranea]|nr:hypothetical protein F4809DRAFT_663497 [Biscogniauxia mediterranea]
MTKGVDPFERLSRRGLYEVANLDFEARVPVPFSIFPRTYKEAEAETTTKTHTEIEIDLPLKEHKAGREGQYSSSTALAQLPPRREQRFSEEEVRITREEERYRRPGVHSEHFEFRPSTSHHENKHHHHHHHRPQSSHSETIIKFDHHHHKDHHHQHKAPYPEYSPIDEIEREYRSRVQPAYKEDTTDYPVRRPSPSYSEKFESTETTVDSPKIVPVPHQDTAIVEEIIEYPRHRRSSSKSKPRMGYYDDAGNHHSLREGNHKMADRLLHSDSVEVIRETHHSPNGSRGSAAGSNSIPNTVTIPCHHIRMGDILMLQGRPCQVIRISTSSATGQHRYLGVDLFTKQLHEESSFVSNPAPSVVVQTMLGPVFKQYRVLDMQDGTIVAMTETGDVKTGIPVADQGGLWSRLSAAFNTGHGSVRVLVLNDNGRELVVDMKVVHGSRL